MMKKKSAGRPPGSKNYQYQPVVEIPPSCSKCGCTTFETVGKPPIVKPIAGTKDGHAYNRVVWTDKVCTGCGQRIRVTSFQKTIAPSNKTAVSDNAKAG